MITVKTTNDDRVHRRCWWGLGGLWGYEWRGGLPSGFGIKTVNKDTRRRWVAFVPEQKQ